MKTDVSAADPDAQSGSGGGGRSTDPVSMAAAGERSRVCFQLTDFCLLWHLIPVMDWNVLALS